MATKLESEVQVLSTENYTTFQHGKGNRITVRNPYTSYSGTTEYPVEVSWSCGGDTSVEAAQGFQAALSRALEFAKVAPHRGRGF